MLFTVYQVNAVIEVFCALFSLVGLFCVILFAQSAQRSAHWYRRSVSLMFVFNMVGALADAVSGISRGRMTTLGWYGTHLGNALSYVALFLLLGAFTSYLCARLEKERDLGCWGGLVWAVCAVGIALTLSGLFYVIDPATNLYQRTQYFWISQAIGVVVQAGNLVVLLAKRNQISRQSLMTIALYIVLPLVALIAQIHIYGLVVTQMATTAGLMIVFMDLQTFLAQSMSQQQEALGRQERQLSDGRIQIITSQIQSRFLFHTLDSIYYLCGKDSARAQDAISRFSDYLRANLHSLRAASPVPFASELDHVKDYLELEQMSSGDAINLVLDIQATDFMLPALSLQPLVENAVRHGVAGRADENTITLRTAAFPDRFEVTVEDDGVGFDDEVSPDDDSRMGIQNVSQRIASLCGGTLTVTSEEGRGTTALVTIPR